MKQRIHSIDIVRGLIMIIMTLDHTRDFLNSPGSPLNMQTTTVILFFTRWITHFCAPTFAFLSGVSVYLAAQKRTGPELRRFLLTRGAWLILSDMLLVTFLFTFDPLYHLIVLEVLSAIGFGMILLALLSRARTSIIAAIGVIIVFGHNLLNYVTLPQTGLEGYLNTMFLSAFGGASIPLGGTRAIIQLYAFLPWSGAVLLGYVFGALYRTGYDSKKRQAILLYVGITSCLLFIILRSLNGYGDQSHWSVQRNFAHTLLSFLNASKQPPSLLFFLMTLGPVLILLSVIEKYGNRFTAICRVYGNVPYFYFIIHICLLRAFNLALIFITGLPYKSDGNPLVWQAAGYGFPLWVVYPFWILVVFLLYLPCQWYGKYKRSHQQWWLSYI